MRKRRLKNYRCQISLKTLIIFCLSLVPTKISVNAEVLFKSPVINANGTVTFKAAYTGEKLFLVGSMNKWDNTGIEMSKNSEGIFEVTLPLEEKEYEYKYFPTSGSWDNGFTDPQNPNKKNDNSFVKVSYKVESPVIEGNKVTLNYRPSENVSKVYLAGSMYGGDWGATKKEMTYDDAMNVWSITLEKLSND